MSSKVGLTKDLETHYNARKADIRKRLEDFKNVRNEDYFYELCYCLCTPQTKAKNAFEIQKILKEKNFFNNEISNLELILNNPKHNIRFHNEKAKRLISIKNEWAIVEALLNTKVDNYTKRNWLARGIDGFGYKEASHFLRNIGYEGLAILDRHILKMLVECGVYNSVPDISTKAKYFEVEQKLLEFSNKININVDEIDLLFWSKVNGEILK